MKKTIKVELTPHEISRVATAISKFDVKTRHNYDSVKNALSWHILAAKSFGPNTLKRWYHREECKELIQYLKETVLKRVPHKYKHAIIQKYESTLYRL
jgi:hypothetical protein